MSHETELARLMADNDGKREHMFMQRMHAFSKHWGPDDQRDRLDFEAELFSLMRSLMLDASEAFGRGAARVTSMHAPLSIFASNLDALTQKAPGK
jgi:hypothetical protein